MNRSLKKRTETALAELATTYDLVRELLIQRLEEVDTERMRKRGSEYAGKVADRVDTERMRKRGSEYASKLADRIDDIDTKALQRRGYRAAGALRKEVERRVSKEVDRRMRPRRRPAWPIAGLAILGAGMAALAWAMYDRSRREAVRERLTVAQSRARERYADLGGVGGAIGKVSGRTNGQDNGLKSRVDQAMDAGGTRPYGVDVSVEGRTVYLRGTVDDPAAVDAAAERIHAVDGVVAVVNLTTGRPTAGGSTTGGSTTER